MPLPDADKKSPRVYTLLQNQDLENLSGDDLANVADPIAIEEANEDELRRLCLVAFARMVTKGSFDGWLSGGGAGLESVIPTANIASTFDRHMVTKYPMTGSNSTAQATITATNYSESTPFIAPQSGVIDEVGVVVSNGHANTLRIGIYTNDGLRPDELMGYADIDTASTATVYQTSWSSTVTLVRGTVYHLMWVRLTAASMASSLIVSESNASLFYNSASDAVRAAPNAQCVLALSGNNNDLEATVTAANLVPTFNPPLRCTLKFA